MKHKNTFYKEDTLQTSYVGVIEDVEDPTFEGRCRVRVFGKLDALDANGNFKIPTEKLPWARPENKISSYTSPKLGSIVRVYFDNDNLYSPVWSVMINLNDDLKNLIKSKYKNANVLLYDLALDNNNTIKIYFLESEGLTLEHGTSDGANTIKILSDNTIEIKTAKNSFIMLDSEGNIKIAANKVTIDSEDISLGNSAGEPLVLGNTFKKLWETHIHPTAVGPSGTPTVQTNFLSQTSKTK